MELIPILFLLTTSTILLCFQPTYASPIPSDTSPSTPPQTTSPPPSQDEEEDFIPPALIIEGEDHAVQNPDDDQTNGASPPEKHSPTQAHRRHVSTPSPAELEARRTAFIKSLGGNEDSAPVLLSSLQGITANYKRFCCEFFKAKMCNRIFSSILLTLSVQNIDKAHYLRLCATIHILSNCFTI